MKVLHLDTGRDMRGGQYQVLSLLEQAGDGHILLARGGSPLLREAHARGLDARPFSWVALLRMSRLADLIHAHDAHSHTRAALVGGAPLVVSRRVAFPVKRSIVSDWKYRQPVRFIAVSQYVAGTLEAAGIERSRISVVYDGVDVPSTPACGPRVIAPAFNDPMKGTDLLPQGVEQSEHLSADLPQARVFVYLTRFEGLGSAALLAMAHGVTVVASRVGGLPEIVQDGVTGILTDNDPQAIRTAMERALAGGADIGPRARQSVIERFTTVRMAANTMEVYRKVLGC